MQVIQFNKLGTSFGNRKQGEEIRKEIQHHLDNNIKVIFDFNGVDVITSSFADECFAKLIQENGIDFIKSRTNFINTNKNVNFVIMSSINKRMVSTK